jgi:hypothetical protein
MLLGKYLASRVGDDYPLGAEQVCDTRAVSYCRCLHYLGYPSTACRSCPHYYYYSLENVASRVGDDSLLQSWLGCSYLHRVLPLISHTALHLTLLPIPPPTPPAPLPLCGVCYTLRPVLPSPLSQQPDRLMILTNDLKAQQINKKVDRQSG